VKGFIATTIDNFLNEKMNVLNSNDILVIVDVQKIFTDKRFANRIMKYAEKFKSVYQIYYEDFYGIYGTDLDDGPDYKFPNEIGCYSKGLNFYEYALLEIDWSNDIQEKLDNDDFDIGYILPLPMDSKFSGDLIVKIRHNQWLLVDYSLQSLYKILKDKNIILVGGAVNECLLDVFVSMKAFNINVKINNNLTY
jgi:hypothetical protein